MSHSPTLRTSIRETSRPRARALFVAVVAALALAVQPVLAATGITERASVDSAGGQADGASGEDGLAISADGRYVAFSSFATNLVAGDTNGFQDVFVRDLVSDTTTRVSVSSAGAQSDWHSYTPSISADGRFVAFESGALTLVPNISQRGGNIYVHDRTLGTTEAVSVDSAGIPTGNAQQPAMSADGSAVAWVQFGEYIYVRDRVAGSTERADVDNAGIPAYGSSSGPAISGNGRYVVFHSGAANLVVDDTNATEDIFLRDRVNGTTERVSLDSVEGQAAGQSFGAAISGDGNVVAFESSAANLVVGDTNASRDLFVRDRTAGTTERVNVDSDENQAIGTDGGLWKSLSADGNVVAFESFSANLVPDDTNGTYDIFLRDRAASTTDRVSLTDADTESNGASLRPSTSAGGGLIAFYSRASNLVPSDGNNTRDVFVRAHRALGPPTIVSTTPAAGATGVPVGTSVSATFDQPVDTATLTLKNSRGRLVKGSVSCSSPCTTVTFIPTRQLGYAKTYTAAASGTNANGTASLTWTFKTASRR